MRRSLVHRVAFQLHLWAGLSLGIYAFLIGVTGSVLVFREEIVRHLSPVPRLDGEPSQGTLQRMYEGIQAQNPGSNVWSLEAPRAPKAPWAAYLLRRGSGRSVLAGWSRKPWARWRSASYTCAFSVSPTPWA